MQQSKLMCLLFCVCLSIGIQRGVAQQTIGQWLAPQQELKMNLLRGADLGGLPLVTGNWAYPIPTNEYVANLNNWQLAITRGKRLSTAQNGALPADSSKLVVIDQRDRVLLYNVRSGRTLFKLFRKRGGYKGDYRPVLCKDSLIYVVEDGGYISAYNWVQNKIAWSFTMAGNASSQPVVTNNLVLVCDKTRMYALDKLNGQRIWQLDLGQQVASGIEVHGNNAYVFANSTGLMSIALGTGQVNWAYSITDLPVYVDIYVQDAAVYFANNYVYGIDLTNGQKLYQSEQSGFNSTAISGIDDFVLAFVDDDDEPIPTLFSLTLQELAVSFTGPGFEYEPGPEAETEKHIMDLVYSQFVGKLPSGLIILAYEGGLWGLETLSK